MRDLKSFAVLDTPPERAFDELTRLAAAICGTPIALVSLVDDERQWFKSRVGLDAAQTPRAWSFCQHALGNAEGELLVIEDARADARVCASPLVTGPPRIGFYAGAPLVSRTGHVLGTLCVIDERPRAITDLQRDALRTLARQVVAQLELRRAAAELEMLVGVLGHDLRNPVAALVVAADLLRHPAASEEQRRAAATRVAGTARRLNSMLRDLLDFSRARHGALPAAPKPCDLAQIARQVVDELEAVHPGRIRLTEAGDCRGEWDPSRAGQLVSNLVANAVQHSAPGSQVRVRIRGGDGGPVTLEVANEGIPIPPEQVPLLFEPFRRGSGPTAGAGLGLFIVREIARAHGAEISVGSGDLPVVFTVRWPRPARAA